MDFSQTQLRYCPICGNGSIAPICSERYAVGEGVVLINFVWCKHCDFVFQKNPLDPKSIQNYYKYKASRHRTVETSTTKAALRRKQIDFISQDDRCRLHSVLEIGADDGGFLNACADKWRSQTYFDEINELACELLQNQGHEKFVKSKPYDLIALLQVFEHVVQPYEFLKTLRGNLSDQGLILLEIPNHTFWDGYDYTFSLEHTNYFSSKSLTLLIAKAGFALMNWEITSDDHYLDGKTRIIRCLIRVMSEDTDRVDLIRRHYDSQKAAKFHRLNDYILNCLDIGETVGLYGIGEVVRSLNLLHKVHPKIILLDSDRSKQEFSGSPIRPPEYLAEINLDKIVITCNVFREVQEKLVGIGFRGKIVDWRNLEEV